MNTIEKIEREYGRRVTSFHEIVDLEAYYFKGVYWEPNSVNIVDIIILT
jgi:hypothetical protein